MAIKVKIPRSKSKSKSSSRYRRISWSHAAVKLAIVFVLVVMVVALGIFAHFYVKYDRMVEKRIRGPIFANAARIYARPHTVVVGDKETLSDIAADLRMTGYVDSSKYKSQVGTYKVLDHAIQVNPGPLSFHSEDGAIIRVSGDKVEKITGTGDAAGRVLSAYELEPPLLTALDTEERAKRQLVKYADIPKVMVDAVTSIEDRRFFQHNGVNFFRLAQAAWVDLRSGRRGQGGSTITMQMARGFFLNDEKTYKRKITEIMIAMAIERKLSKQQIFEMYANQVDLGQRGSYTIHGFAEAARAYFNKDLQSVSLPEAALLAGMVQRPSYLNPYRHPERALERRNLVLDSMVETGAVTKDDAERAKATPLKLAPMNVEASDAPYFVDLVKEKVASTYGEHEVNEQALRIYTTLDGDLQKAAADAVQEGIKNVDEQLTKLRTHKRKVGKGKNAKTETTVTPGPLAQVALVAIDPHTGEVLALVGGRNYGQSQLNHAIARRPTGSIFKPFVYAAAINTAVSGASAIWTPSSMLNDEQTTFQFGDQEYSPRNYHQEYHTEVTAEYALAHSLNNATVKLAEQVGYDNVATLAKAAGIRSVQATPAMALGAYDATPLEMAGAYTVFANNGVRVAPTMLKAIHNANGDVLATYQGERTPVLDPRVAYVMTTMMEGVVNTGTGYTVRQYGFTSPAAGKTGTSHDAWFAGYTTNLLCIVWVGLDDYTDIRLSGTAAAAPIWADFMKRAVKLSAYKDATEFPQPDGVVDVRLDKLTNLLATPNCPQTYTVAFIVGTEPKATCEQGADHAGLLTRILGFVAPKPPANPKVVPPPSPSTQANIRPPQSGATPTQPLNQPPPAPDQTANQKPKKGLFGKIGAFLKGDKPPDQTNQTNQQGTPQQ